MATHGYETNTTITEPNSVNTNKRDRSAYSGSWMSTTRTLNC